MRDKRHGTSLYTITSGFVEWLTCGNIGTDRIFRQVGHGHAGLDNGQRLCDDLAGLSYCEKRNSGEDRVGLARERAQHLDSIVGVCWLSENGAIGRDYIGVHTQYPACVSLRNILGLAERGLLDIDTSVCQIRQRRLIEAAYLHDKLDPKQAQELLPTWGGRG